MGTPAPGGEVSFELAPWQSTQLTMADLESGNAGKGLSGKFGTGSGHWRLTAMSSLDLRVLSLVRTPNGFLTDLGASVPAQDGSNDIWVFNPASNIRQRSILRLINSGDDDAIATIAGIDDEGIQGSAVQAEIPAQTAYFLSSADLEHGNAEKGLIGAMGNGTGKWRLQVQADPTVQVMNLLETNDGFVTNLSRAGH